MSRSNSEAISESDARAVAGIALSPDFADDGTGYAATNQGLVRTVDGGRSWRSCFASLPAIASIPVTAVATSPRFPHDGSVVAAISGGIGWSQDQGASWRFARLPLPAPHVTALAVSPDGRFAYAATLQDGLFRSDDAGQSWTAWNFGLIDYSALSLAVSPAFAGDQTVLAGTSTGLMRSRNAGRSWQRVDLPADSPAISAIAHADATIILAGTEAHGLFRSADGGGTWSACGDEQFRSIISLTIHQGSSVHREILAISDTGLALSTDRGQTWLPVSAGEAEPPGLTCAAPGGAGILIAGDSAGDLHRILV